MVGPFGLLYIGRAFPPALFGKHILVAIAVKIAVTNTMSEDESILIFFFTNIIYVPRGVALFCGRLYPNHLLSFGISTKYIQPAVAVHINKTRRFVTYTHGR